MSCLAARPRRRWTAKVSSDACVSCLAAVNFRQAVEVLVSSDACVSCLAASSRMSSFFVCFIRRMRVMPRGRTDQAAPTPLVSSDACVSCLAAEDHAAPGRSNCFIRRMRVMPRGWTSWRSRSRECFIRRMRVMPRGRNTGSLRPQQVSSDACVSCLAADVSPWMGELQVSSDACVSCLAAREIAERHQELFHPTHACHASRPNPAIVNTASTGFVRRMRVMPRGGKGRATRKTMSFIRRMRVMPRGFRY